MLTRSVYRDDGRLHNGASAEYVHGVFDHTLFPMEINATNYGPVTLLCLLQHVWARHSNHT